MKKRVMSALLALCLCLALLPGAAFAAYEPLVEVDAVSVSVPAPTVEDGLEVPTVAGDAPYFIDSLYAPDDIDTNLFYWNRVAAKGCDAVAGDLYEEGGTSLVNNSWYRLQVKLLLDYGYVYGERVTGTVPGAERVEVERYKDDTIYLSAWFKVGNPSETPTTVSTVTISGVPTERAETIQAWTDAIQNAAVSEGCRIYYASLREWDSTDGQWHYSDSSGSTDAGKIYGAMLTVNPLPDHVFARAVTATVNGSAAEIVDRSMDEVEIFVPFGNVTIDKVEVKSATWPIDGNPIPKDADNFYLNDYFSDGKYPYTLKSARFQIEDGDSYRDLKDEETIFSGYNDYRVIAELEAKDYASFADTVTGDFNGKSGTECQTSNGGKTCTVTRTCAVYDRIYTYSVNAPDNHINSVTIYQDDPQPGDGYADGEYAPSNGSKTKLVGIDTDTSYYSWDEVPCVGSTESLKRLSANDIFEDGKVYLYTMRLNHYRDNRHNYCFGDGFTVSFKQLDGSESNYAMKRCETDTEKRKVYNLWYIVGDVTQTPITRVAVTGPAYQNGSVDISDPGAFRADAPVTLRSFTYNNNYLGFTLLPQSGHYFDRTVAVTYNGKEARVSDGFFSSFDTKYVGVRFSSEPATPVTVTGITAQDKVYDGTAAATLTGGTLEGVEENDDVQLELSGAKAAFESKDVGTDRRVTIHGVLKLKGADAGKYELTQPAALELRASITACTAFDDATNRNQTIYVGEDSFEAPRFTGIGGEEVTGTLRYTLAEGGTEELPALLRALKAGEGLYLPYHFTASGNYSGERTGSITVTAQERPASGGAAPVAPSYPVTTPDRTENGSVSASRESASRGTRVTVTVRPDSGYVLEELTVTDKNGAVLELTEQADGSYTFLMPGSRVEIKATFMEDNAVLSFFYDVPNDSFYYEAVKWAVETKITSGVGNNLFAPDQPCTRAQIVTFLWRAAGSPEPKNVGSFSDVPASAYYAKAVAWAVENGITTGTGEGGFSPDEPCTRAQAVTLLCRAQRAKAEGRAQFSDVPADAYYAEAVAWAAESGVTDGIGGGLFGPEQDCTRAQIVTFLWRAMTR